MELMRDYQLAKSCVKGRRYDEALRLYHHALLYDPDNAYLQYDVCQILERLQLFPDALIRYERLMSSLFPVCVKGDRVTRRRLRHNVVNSHDDAYSIRYRYVAALSVAWRLAHELITPEWDELKEWLQTDAEAARGTRAARRQVRKRGGFRPWRATEVADLRQRLADVFSKHWCPSLSHHAVLAYEPDGLHLALCEAIDDNTPAFVKRVSSQSPAQVQQGTPPPDSRAWQALAQMTSELADGSGSPTSPVSSPMETLRSINARARRKAVEQFFLTVAQREVTLLRRSLWKSRLSWRRWSITLTPVIVALLELNIEMRRERFNSLASGWAKSTQEQPRSNSSKQQGQGHPLWDPTLQDIDERLGRRKYRESSPRWMEHYVAACCYALPLVADDREWPGREAYAAAAVAALERAHVATEEIDFVISKRFWLLAGDPDLAGLRQYRSFRAFESRVYLHPQPATRDSAKYELLYFLRRVMEQGTRELETLWRRRAEKGEVPSGRQFEQWFRQERRAWELCVRLGRFHKQWQTRDRALTALRLFLGESLIDDPPLAFPEAIADYGLSDIGHEEATTVRIEGMEKLLGYLANSLGSAAAVGPPVNDSHPDLVLNQTRAWIWYAEHWSAGAMSALRPEQLVKLCDSRAEAWSGLRTWVTTPSRRGKKLLAVAIAGLERAPTPPSRKQLLGESAPAPPRQRVRSEAPQKEPRSGLGE